MAEDSPDLVEGNRLSVIDDKNSQTISDEPNTAHYSKGMQQEGGFSLTTGDSLVMLLFKLQMYSDFG